MPWNRLMVVTVVVAAVVMGAASFSHALNPFKRSGFELSESDIAMLKAAAKKLYLAETVEVGEVKAWNNAETGNNGTVTLTRKHAYKGLPCRRLQHDIRIKKTADPFRFIVDRCKTADGSWKLL
jgi:surface antigen